MNAKQTQVHPCNPSQGGCGGLVHSRSRHMAESSPYRINDPWLSCRIEAIKKLLVLSIFSENDDYT